MPDDREPLRRVPRPPRAVAVSLRTSLVFGGVVSQIGWFLAAFGMLFVHGFDAGAGLAEALLFRGALDTADGTATGWRPTDIRVGEVQVYETSYVFRLPDGGSVPGSSFETGSWLEEGQPVVVEYRRGNPSRSRIRGMRASAAGQAVAVIFLLPMVGFAIAAVGVRRGLRARRLLVSGEVAGATLESTEPTRSSVNRQPVLALTFRFEATRGGTYEVVARTHDPAPLRDESHELVVYDPTHPEDAMLLDDLPCRPRFDDRGTVVAGRPGPPAALRLVLPTVAISSVIRYLLAIV